jgi:hypothetical protein
VMANIQQSIDEDNQQDSSPFDQTSETQRPNSAPTSPWSTASPASKGLSFAELLKMNMPKESPKSNQGTPIMSIPASEIALAKANKKNKAFNKGNSVSNKRGPSNDRSGGKRKEDHEKSTTLTPPREDYGLFATVDDSTSAERSEENAHILPTPPSELASTGAEDALQETRSISPAVNVWQVRMQGQFSSSSQCIPRFLYLNF